jgi:hypothetical protein
VQIPEVWGQNPPEGRNWVLQGSKGRNMAGMSEEEKGGQCD